MTGKSGTAKVVLLRGGGEHPVYNLIMGSLLLSFRSPVTIPTRYAIELAKRIWEKDTAQTKEDKNYLFLDHKTSNGCMTGFQLRERFYPNALLQFFKVPFSR
jgi:hypothetical protein